MMNLLMDLEGRLHTVKFLLRDRDTMFSAAWDAVLTSAGDVAIAVAEYIDWFNHRRLHGEIGLVPLVEFEATHWASTGDQHYRHNPDLTKAGSR